MRKRQIKNILSNDGKTEGQLKKEFAIRLRQLRDGRKQTQSQVAKDLGFASESVYQLWEKGDGNLPSALNLRKLAGHFGVSTDYLLGLQGAQAGTLAEEVQKDAQKEAQQDYSNQGNQT